MKRLLSSLLFMTLLGTAAIAEADDKPADVLVLQLKSGALHAFVLADKPSVLFSDSQLRVQSPVVEADYTDVARFYFDNAENVVGIQAPRLAAGRLVFSYVDANTVRIQGVNPKDAVGVYGIDGKVYQPETDRTDAELTVHLNALQRGVYMIRINQYAYKITKR